MTKIKHMDAFVSKSPIQKYKEIIEIRTDVSFLELYGMEYLIENFDEEGMVYRKQRHCLYLHHHYCLSRWDSDL